MTIYDRPRRFLNSHLGAVIVITIFIALIAVISVRAIQVLRQAATGAVIRVPADFPTIQAAIEAAKPGDIVQVSAGTYSENLILNKPVTLVGETFDQVNPANNLSILDGGGGAATISIPAGLTQMPTVRGLVIHHGVDGIQATSPFIAEFTLSILPGTWFLIRRVAEGSTAAIFISTRQTMPFAWITSIVPF
jgi:hypothetical protein